MGGVGSGRWGWRSGADTTEGYRSIDVRELARAGALEPGTTRRVVWSAQGEVVASLDTRAEPGRLILTRGAGDGTQAVDLTRTACHLGGARHWFCCSGCGRRVGLLYDAGGFACRKCRQLVYPSQRERAFVRALRREDRFCDRMGWSDAARGRPKGMHQRTYEQRCREHAELSERSLYELMVLLGWPVPGP